MKRIFFLSLLIFITSVTATKAQSDFEKVEKACILAQSSLYSKGSPSEMLNAASLLKKTKWSVLNMQNVDTKAEVSVNGRLVFVPEFLDSLYNNRLVYDKAAKYLEKAERNSHRGTADMVRLTTKGIAPNGTVVYGLRISGNISIDISAVTEPYGAINMKVKVQNDLKSQGKVYSDKYYENEGNEYRKIRGIKSEGNKILLIEITNCKETPVNYALIMRTKKQ